MREFNRGSLSCLTIFILSTLIAAATCNTVDWQGKSYITTPSHVEVIDGVEYVDAAERNATMLSIFG